MEIQVSLHLSAYSYTTFSHFGMAVSFSYLHHRASTSFSFNKTHCQRSGRGGLGDPDAQNYFIGHSRFGFNRLIADLAL